MRFDVVTLFPQIFDGYLTQSLLAKAIEATLVEIECHDLRRWSDDPRHHKIDDRPYGGGPGMLIQAPPTVQCVEEIEQADERPARRILLTPGGRRFNQRVAEELATESRLILLCGRYEGFDQRVSDILQPDEISVGDFVLNGGEVAAMLIIDAVVRLVPGVLGDPNSSLDDSFSRGNRLLEFPQYTRPRHYRGYDVPEVLLSGDHQRIAAWRAEQTRMRTASRRADLLD